MNSKNQKKNLLVFAGTGVEVKDKSIYTKPQFVDYFNELALYYNITWITSEYNSGNFNSELNSIRVISVPKKRFKLNVLKIQTIFFLKAFHTDRILLFLPGGFMLFPLIFLITFFKKKLFTYIGVDFRNQTYSTNWFIQSIWTKSLALLMQKSEGVVCRGNYLMKEVKKINRKGALINTIPLAVINSNVHFIPLPIEVKFKMKQLLFVGQVKRSKGIFDLINVLNRLDDETIRLSVVGTGENLEEAKAMAKQLKIDHRINFAGWLDSIVDLSFVYNTSTILVQPSIEPEGVPRSIDEAIFYNTPVIATKVGGVNLEFSNDEIMKVDPSKIDELKNAIQKMLGSFNGYLKYYNALQKRKTFITNSTPALQHSRFIEQCMTKK